MRALLGRCAPAAYAGALLAAAFGAPSLFVLAVVLTYATEPLLKQASPKTNQMLSRVGFGLSVRYALRDASLIVLVARLHDSSWLETASVTVAIAALIGARGAFRYLAQRTSDRRKLPIATRNIDLSACKIRDAAPAFLTGGGDAPMLYAGGIPLVGVLIGAFTGSAVPATIAAGLAALTAIGLVAAAIRPARRAGRMPSATKVLAEVQRQINGYAPDVVIYFSGTRPSMYQLNMWLPVAARLRQRVLIVMRQSANMSALAATSLPVVCLPDSVDLMNFALPSMRVALYPTHVGQNIHFLRIPGVSHVFTCHGESDKLASVNPYSKAYDEVWVAGLAARERYALAEVGVRDEDIVEVGGPHLAMIQHATAEPTTTDRHGLTVLYAPTWEGWTDDPQNTSLVTAGPQIVARLLAHPAVTRVIFKPHPLTGTRSAAAAKASKKIVALLRDSGASVGVPAELRADLDTALAAATALHRDGVDPAQASRDDGRIPHDVEARIAAASARWSEAFWSGATDRVVVTGSEPSLFECFNAADVLIADISGVVADFLVSAKPYVVTNSSDLDDDAFAAKYPTTRGAYVIDPSGTGLDQILFALSAGDDPMAEERRKLGEYVLGGADDRFQAAVDRLIDVTTQRMIRRGDIRG